MLLDDGLKLLMSFSQELLLVPVGLEHMVLSEAWEKDPTSYSPPPHTSQTAIFAARDTPLPPAKLTNRCTWARSPLPPPSLRDETPGGLLPDETLLREGGGGH